MQTRLNDPKTGAFIIIMQRVHENDLTGHILANEYNAWDHLCLPARYEIGHPTPTKSSLGFTDPRTKEGELLWEKRIDEKTLDTLEKSLGSGFRQVRQKIGKVWEKARKKLRKSYFCSKS